MRSFDELFYAHLQDVYFAEKQLLKALPKLAKNSTNARLSKAFTDHLQETETHVDRLERVFDMVDKNPRARKCEGIMGIIAEGEEVMEEVENDAVRDAGLVASGQAAEHYEIALYGALIAWAEVLGLEDAVPLLSETLDEEKRADALLTSIAGEGVNEEAAEQTKEMAEQR